MSTAATTTGTAARYEAQEQGGAQHPDAHAGTVRHGRTVLGTSRGGLVSLSVGKTGSRRQRRYGRICTLGSGASRCLREGDLLQGNAWLFLGRAHVGAVEVCRSRIGPPPCSSLRGYSCSQRRPDDGQLHKLAHPSSPTAVRVMCAVSALASASQTSTGDTAQGSSPSVMNGG
jgi:hypothetical protein